MMERITVTDIELEKYVLQELASGRRAEIDKLRADDVVITADIPLAADAIARGAEVVSPRASERQGVRMDNPSAPSSPEGDT